MEKRNTSNLKWISLGIFLLCLGILCVFGLRTRRAVERIDVELNDSFSLKAGVYQLHLLYDAGADMANTVTVLAPSAGEKLRTNTTILYKGLHETDYDFWLYQDADDVSIQIGQAADSALTVQGAYVLRTNGVEKRQFGYALALVGLVLLGLLLAWPLWQGKSAYSLLKKRENRLVVVGLVLLAILANLPLAVKGIYTGADATFHLLRIEGAKEAILSGQIPVRIEPNWLQGHGYASGIFYSDFFLVIPALMRCFAFDVMESYKMYQLLVTIATVLLSYWSFYRIANGRRLPAYLASSCYTLSIFRLIYLFSMEGVGQFTALTFFPVVAYGLFRVYGRGLFEAYEQNGKEKWAFLPLTLGMACVIQSHVLSVIILTLFLAMTALVFAKWTFRKDTILGLVKAVVVCFLINVWYFLPMMEYSHSLQFAILDGNAIHKRIQTYGMYPRQLFTILPRAGLYGAYPVENGPADELHYTIGLGLMIVMAFVAVLIIITAVMKWKTRKNSATVSNQVCGTAIATWLFVLSLLSMWMTTYQFPWDAIAEVHPVLERLVAMVQFQTRFQSITVLCISLLAIWACHTMGVLLGKGEHESQSLGARVCLILFFALVMAGVLTTSGSFIHSLRTDAGTMQIYDETCMGNGYISGGEYILLGTDVSSLTYDDFQIPERVELLSNFKENGKLILELINRNDGTAQIQVPLLYYPGYQADGYAAENSVDIPSKLQVRNQNQKIAVELPAGFMGRVEIAFREPARWIAYDFISLIAIFVVLFGFFRCQGYGKNV